MGILDAINPALVDAWFRAALRANTVLAASHGNRFWQERAVPSVAQGLAWPYIFWQPVAGSKRSTKSILPKEYIGQQTSVWRVWSVRRWTTRPDMAAFNPDILEMRKVLTGVDNVHVMNNSTILGYIRSSTLYPPEEVEQEDDRDDDISIISKGIVIRVTHY